jgi:hypothetical protein
MGVIDAARSAAADDGGYNAAGAGIEPAPDAADLSRRYRAAAD